MAKIIFVKDEEEQFQAYDFIQDLIQNQPLMATLLLQGMLELEQAETRKLSTGKQVAPDIHLTIGKSQAYSLQSTRVETSIDQPLHELKLHFKDKNCRLIYFTAFSEMETYYCFIKGYFKDKNPFTDQMGAYREEAKRIFLSRVNADLSIGQDNYSFESLKELAWKNDGMTHYLESFSAVLARVIVAKRITKKMVPA